MDDRPAELLASGLYETLITAALKGQLEALRGSLNPELVQLESAEAANRIAFHLRGRATI